MIPVWYLILVLSNGYGGNSTPITSVTVPMHTAETCEIALNVARHEFGFKSGFCVIGVRQ